MDFPSTWKVVSIAATGFFGILGLVTEFKDPKTKKLTRWGAISLGGIVISAVLGIKAQVGEISKQQKNERDQQSKIADDTKQTLELSRRTNEAVASLRRLVLPQDAPNLTVTLSASCADVGFKSFCQKVFDWQSQLTPKHLDPEKAKFELDAGATRIWGKTFHNYFALKLAFFCAKRFASKDLEWLARGDHTPDFEFVVREENTGKENSRFDVAIEGGNVNLNITEGIAHDIHASGEVSGITDLAGCRLAVAYPAPNFMMPTMFIMQNSTDDRIVRLDPTRFVTIQGPEYHIGYQFDASGG